MTRYVGFLRAVNVGGNRKVPMAQLRELVDTLGYTDVSTHINSGNVAFTAPGKAADVEQAIEQALLDAFGFAVETFVRTHAELTDVIGRTPFPVADGDTHMVVFVRSRLPAAIKKVVEALSNDTDELVVVGREVHWRVHGGLLASKLKPRDWKALGDQPSTARNTTMLRKLVAKLDA